MIYELLDDAKSEMEKMMPEEIEEKETGSLSVKGVFKIGKHDLIAGGLVETGKVEKGSLGRAYRKKELLGEFNVENVQAGKVDVENLVKGELGGLALKTEKRINLEVGDKLVFFVREIKKKRIA